MDAKIVKLDQAIARELDATAKEYLQKVRLEVKALPAKGQLAITNDRVLKVLKDLGFTFQGDRLLMWP